MVNFTLNEKLAIMRILKGIAIADEKIDVREMKFLVAARNELGLSSQEFSNADNYTLLEAANMLQALTNEEKQEVSDLMALATTIDGHIDSREMEIVKFVFLLCNLPTPRLPSSAK